MRVDEWNLHAAPLPRTYGYIRWRRASTHSDLLRSRAATRLQRSPGLWQEDVTSPFPPSGNEGYLRNRDVPPQSFSTTLRQ
ncbi:hypothetical protein QQF64_029911 [Cirrhinus molitorella]|uniref:Uncharacterized protein n=1 Tax=Cirrhinus molitorella TaxID=172907 RepID=A0ABR3N267_9TELE